MMTMQEHLLVCLAEEAAELAHRIHKALRFGLEEIQDGQAKTNRERIEEEAVDLVSLLDILEEREVISLPLLEVPYDLTRAKREKLSRYLAYAQGLGTLHAG